MRRYISLNKVTFWKYMWGTDHTDRQVDQYLCHGTPSITGPGLEKGNYDIVEATSIDPARSEIMLCQCPQISQWNKKLRTYSMLKTQNYEALLGFDQYNVCQYFTFQYTVPGLILIQLYENSTHWNLRLVSLYTRLKEWHWPG